MTNEYLKSNRNESSISVDEMPTMIPDPFDPQSMLDLSKVDNNTIFNLVDGTCRASTAPSWPFVLLKGQVPDTFFYAPRWGKLATRSDKVTPAFTITQKTKRKGDGSYETTGGLLSFVVEMVTEIPAEKMREEWNNLIEDQLKLHPTDGSFRFQPLKLINGRMNVDGFGKFASEDQRLLLKDVKVGAADSIGFAVELTAEGAEHYAKMIKNELGPFVPQVVINFTFDYQYYVPNCEIEVIGLKKATYDYFNQNFKARAAYWGIGGSADHTSIQKDLKEQSGLSVKVMGLPPEGVDLERLIESLTDMWIKKEVGKWIDPDKSVPAESKDPNGFYGGVSVSFKKETFNAEDKWEVHHTYSSIVTETFNMSFNFEQQVPSIDPNDHLIVVRDDTQLDFNLSIGGCSDVNKIIPSATYLTKDGPQKVTCNSVNNKGGESKGIIQFESLKDMPTSAHVNMMTTFEKQNNKQMPGYIYEKHLKMSNSGIAFLFEPDVYINRTPVFFFISIITEDPKAYALFSWEWTPPEGKDRLKISNSVWVAPTSDDSIPTYTITFPFHPDDLNIKEIPKIKYSLQGMRGEWNKKIVKGECELNGPPITFAYWDEQPSAVASIQ